MARRHVTVSQEWAPSDLQSDVLDYRAAGYSQNRTAQLVSALYEAKGAEGVTQQGISKWENEIPEFQAELERRQRELIASQKPKFAKLLDTCQDIMQRVADGQLEPNHRLAQWAYSILDRTYIPVWRANGLADAIGRMGSGDMGKPVRAPEYLPIAPPGQLPEG